MSYTKVLKTSGAMQLGSGSGVIDLNANSYVSCPEIRPTTPLAVAYGGIGSDMSAARTALGVAIGSNVQAYNAKLADIAGLAPSSGNFIKWDGEHFVAGTDNDTTYSADGTYLTLSGTEFQIVSQALKDIADISGPSNGNVIKFNGSNWVAQADASASYSAGNGLALSGSEFAIDGAIVPELGATANAFTGDISVEGNTQVNGAFALGPATGVSGSSVVKQYELKTTNNTQSNLVSFACDADNAYQYEAYVVAANSDASGNLNKFAAFKLDGLVIKNGANNASHPVNNNLIQHDNSGVYLCSASVSGNNLLIQVTGGASDNLRWHCYFMANIAPKYA